MPVPSDPRVLIDFRTADDAGVFALGESGEALVQTVDFFTPIVDDPFAYGRIAGANAVSDIYAMGGRPITALAIAAFPARDFEPAVIREVFAGGLSALQEAGVALLGGHTVQDAEVKFGYAVTGLVHRDEVWSNAGARPGDVLVLTKPLGTGIIATAGKFQRAAPEVLEAAVASMRTLNRAAAEALHASGGVRACTDVTGFGLVGHGCEMAAASGVTLAIDPARVPLLPGALDLALDNRPGGAANNRAHFGTHVRMQDVPEALATVLVDPQTSGGLLAAVAPERLEAAVAEAQARGVALHVIGVVRERAAAAGDAPAGGDRLLDVVPGLPLQP
jgi:selenide,water dikinase